MPGWIRKAGRVAILPPCSARQALTEHLSAEPHALPRSNPRRGGARGHRTTVILVDSALCPPLRVVLVEGRDEGTPGGLHDICGRRPDRNPAARQLHLELDLSDRLAARAD